MSTIHNYTRASSHWLLGTFLNSIHLFLFIALASGFILVSPASAQSNEAPDTKTGSILGAVVDSNNETIPSATVVLQNPVSDPLTVVTKDDGSFAFHDVAPGSAYPITIAAAGFAEWNSSVTVEPGQDKTLTDIKLRILAAHRVASGSYSGTSGPTWAFMLSSVWRKSFCWANSPASVRTNLGFEGVPEIVRAGQSF